MLNELTELVHEVKPAVEVSTTSSSTIPAVNERLSQRLPRTKTDLLTLCNDEISTAEQCACRLMT